MMKSYSVKIFVGFKERNTGVLHTMNEALDICQKYVDDVSLCVNVSPTTYVYKNGREEGCIIELINYPRFPEDCFSNIWGKAEKLAEQCMYSFNQFRVTLQDDTSVKMLSNEKLI
jgi:hypothetical protein